MGQDTLVATRVLGALLATGGIEVVVDYEVKGFTERQTVRIRAPGVAVGLKAVLDVQADVLDHVDEATAAAYRGIGYVIAAELVQCVGLEGIQSLCDEAGSEARDLGDQIEALVGMRVTERLAWRERIVGIVTPQLAREMLRVEAARWGPHVVKELLRRYPGLRLEEWLQAGQPRARIVGVTEFIEIADADGVKGRLSSMWPSSE